MEIVVQIFFQKNQFLIKDMNGSVAHIRLEDLLLRFKVKDLEPCGSDEKIILRSHIQLPPEVIDVTLALKS